MYRFNDNEASLFSGVPEAACWTAQRELWTETVSEGHAAIVQRKDNEREIASVQLQTRTREVTDDWDQIREEGSAQSLEHSGIHMIVLSFPLNPLSVLNAGHTVNSIQ